jgi:hypothetical protein
MRADDGVMEGGNIGIVGQEVIKVGGDVVDPENDVGHGGGALGRDEEGDLVEWLVRQAKSQRR